ncbi:hypothetical protein GCM10023149_02950 [Mucilaginibacter gynuensis]|uniref:Carboxypeptidase-like protein n=1 Tax=Mucilaginibacter gynuensis TaxID=1302236 RepID=A0ABP8FQD5_9SPHI
MNFTLLRSSKKVRLLFTFILLSLVISNRVQAQYLLSKPVSINANHEKLAVVLNEISKQGGFYFSYNGEILRKDSLVTINANNKLVIEVLRLLFNQKYEYAEQNGYIIITPALPRLSLINTDMTNDDNTYSVSGFVVDERNGERLMNASVYEKQQLVSALTDEHGYFRLKFRAGNPQTISITASKRSYKDTSITFLQTISVSQRNRLADYYSAADKGNRVERTGLGRLFISTRQMIQSLNIPDFFAHRPFQVSLTPGLSSHGMFSPQVVNKFSVNLVGGYTAGVNGLEVGGLFNINKRDSRYLQMAGIFNLVGGTLNGLQLAGVNNQVLDTVKGVQVAGFINRSEGPVYGLQLTTLRNDAHKLKGVQIGLVNSADTSEGISIGLLNIIRNGFYKVSLSANTLTNTNISLKTGTHAFYSTLLTGVNISGNNKMYSFGLGVGHDFMFSPSVYLSAEADYQFANTGAWDDRWAQGKLLLNMQLSKHVSLFAGPTYNKYSYTGSQPGYQTRFRVPLEYYGRNPVKRWISWEAGIAFNSTFSKQEEKTKTDNSRFWYLGTAFTGGIGWDRPYKNVYGTELFLQRDLGSHSAGTFTVGYTYHSADHIETFYSGIPNGASDQIFINDFKAIPVKAGIRSYSGKHWFFGGELGMAFGIGYPALHRATSGDGNFTEEGTGIKKSALYAISMGYRFNNGLETGIKFEDYVRFAGIKQFGLRLGYRLKLN